MAYHETTAARVREALAGRSGVVERKMMGGLSFMVDGNMCCSVSGAGGLLVRVGAASMDRMLKEPHVHAMRMGAKTMTGFVRVDPEGYRANSDLAKWVRRGVDFVGTLRER
jgi:TfoX/Sxy family transcriptional regulator of competence genes